MLYLNLSFIQKQSTIATIVFFLQSRQNYDFRVTALEENIPLTKVDKNIQRRIISLVAENIIKQIVLIPNFSEVMITTVNVTLISRQYN